MSHERNNAGNVWLMPPSDPQRDKKLYSEPPPGANAQKDRWALIVDWDENETTSAVKYYVLILRATNELHANPQTYQTFVEHTTARPRSVEFHINRLEFSHDRDWIFELRVYPHDDDPEGPVYFTETLCFPNPDNTGEVVCSGAGDQSTKFAFGEGVQGYIRYDVTLVKEEELASAADKAKEVFLGLFRDLPPKRSVAFVYG